MTLNRRPNSLVNLYWEECMSRVVAKSGNPNDRFHFGKLIHQGLQDEPDFILQIDGGTGESETCGSVFERSVKCAISFQKLGLMVEDNIVLMAPNSLDLAIPMYAALYLGLGIVGLDQFLGVSELASQFEIVKPGVIFCVPDKAKDVQEALKDIGHEATIVTLGGSEGNFSLRELLEKYQNKTAEKNFRPADFDPDTASFLVSTSGTTGLPKCAVCSHKNFAISLPYLWALGDQFPHPTKMCLIVSPIQWLTAVANYLLTPIVKYTRLQTSLPLTIEHVHDMINKYRPTFMIVSPTYLLSLLNSENSKNCDFSSFELLVVGGSAVGNVLNTIRTLLPKCQVIDGYGMSELSGMGALLQNSPEGSCGKVVPILQWRLTDTETNKDIEKPFVPGELWFKGPTIFKEYYKNPTSTKEVFTEDGWFKSGDIFYMDNDGYMYFVERLKLLIKYRNNQISPLEIESVIRKNPGVLDVAVSGIPDVEYGELPVAFVVKKPGHEVASDNLINLVKESLTDTKQLRGGVVFLEEMPLTSTGKIDRRKIKEMAAALNTK